MDIQIVIGLGNEPEVWILVNTQVTTLLKGSL